MPSALRTQISALLSSAPSGEGRTVDALLPLIYDELRVMAHRQLADERQNHPMQTTALVHEAYIRLVDQTEVTKHGRAYFFGAAARAMRQILVDHARKWKAAKRGGGLAMLSLEDDQATVEAYADHLIDLDDALRRLAELNPRQTQVIECRFFGGLSVKETADALDVSERTVANDWAIARAWLYRVMDFPR